MKTDIENFLKSGAYLPKPLRDFHDSKEVFKTMHSIVAVEKNEYAKDVSWVAGQCYVIDIFLWFMARRGWTLQRSRVDADFRDLGADIKARRDQETEAFRQMLAERSANEKVSHTAGRTTENL
jgi:hypothetical protein